MTQPFGNRFRETLDSEHEELQHDPFTQSVSLTDEMLEMLAASDNTLTFTAGKDNDFDE